MRNSGRQHHGGTGSHVSQGNQGSRASHQGPRDHSDPSGPLYSSVSDRESVGWPDMLGAPIGPGNIQPGAVTASTFAETIVPVMVVDQADFTGYLASDYPNRVALLTGDNKLYRSNGTVWSVDTAAVDIVASWLTAGAISAGAIGTSELAVGAVAGGVDNSRPGTPSYAVVINSSGITINDPGGTAVLNGAGFGGSWLSYITSHAYNAMFDSGPTNGNGTALTTGTSAATTVPYWQMIQASGTAVQFSWRNDATVGRLGQIRLNVVSGAASDQTYVRQNIPIAPSGSSAEGTHVVTINGTCTANPAGTLLLFVKTQYIKADGTTTTGTESTVELSPLVGNLDTQGVYVSPNGGVQPTDAAFLRVKIGARRPGGAANTDTMQVEIYGVTVYDVPRYMFWGQGTHMGALTRGNDGSGGGTVGIGAFDPSASAGFQSGLAMTSTVSTFNTALTMAGNVSIVGTGTTFTVSDYVTTFRRDDSATIQANRYYSGATTAGGVVVLSKSRGNSVTGTDAAVVAGDTLFSLQFHGMDAASGSYQVAASIHGLADAAGTVAAGRVDGRLSFRTSNAGTLTEQFWIGTGGNLNIVDGNSIVLGTTTGTRFGTGATQKLAFWGATAVAQSALAPTAVVAISAAGATNTWFRNTTSTGGLGGNAYTVGDIIFALKTVGILP